MDDIDILTRQRFKDERAGKQGANLIDGPDEHDDLGDPDELPLDGGPEWTWL